MQRLQPRDRWWIALLRAYAALRGGDERAGPLAAEAFEQAAALGKPFLPLVREREVAEQLIELAAAHGSAAAVALRQTEQPVTVAVLGRFEVRRAGELVRLPPGKPEQLVKLLAVSGGRIPAEQAIEELWPEVDPQSGRKRLRNVLNRLHVVAPDLANRQGDVLELGEAEVDADVFERQARDVLDRQEGAHRLALARYRGELLPDDRYESWAAAPRERLERLFIALLDAAAAAAEASGQVDEALRHVERALTVDPYDEARYLRGARLLLDQGRRAAALAMLTRGAEAFARLGVPVPGEHEALAAEARS
jgi:DNA-binding SARP family transcriptional activator